MRQRIAPPILLVLLLGCGIAAAQDDQTPSPTPAPSSSPAPAFGQDSSSAVPSVDENPPISAIDEPNLEPHAAPESFLLPGLHFSESIESNIANEPNGSDVGSVTRGMGSLTLQKLWKTYGLALDYIGGVADYAEGGIGVQALQQFDIDNRISWKRGQLAIRDSLSYLPEGQFGYGAYGGGGAYSAGLGSLGSGLLASSAFGGQSSAFIGSNGLAVSLGLQSRLTNLGLVDVVQELTPKSAVTFTAGYGLVHFYGSIISQNALTGPVQENVNFIGSSEYTAQAAYDHVLTARDQIAVSYGYQQFNFSSAGTAFHSQVIQLMYGHRISGRMDFLISAGPQFTRINQEQCALPFIPVSGCSSFGAPLETTGVSRIGVAGRASLRYRFPKTTMALSYQRFDTSGSGIFAGTESNIAQFDLTRPITRVWDLFANAGYSRNTQLQLPGSIVDATNFSYGYAGFGLHRQLGRTLRAFLSYQFNDFGFGGCPAGATSCSSTSNRQVGSFGLDWTPRPIRLD